MRSNTSLRRTRMLVTKLIRLTIETGSATGMHSTLLAMVPIFTPRPALMALVTCILFLAFPHQTFYVAPAVLMPKLYVNAIYMVLNSRIRIMGGRDIYGSSTDMSITSTMIRDITFQAAEVQGSSVSLSA